MEKDIKKYNIEIEYKFLVDKLPLEFDKKVSIIQYYFDKSLKKDLIIELFNLTNQEFDELSIARIRVIEEEGQKKYIVTVKSKGALSRKEYEKEVSFDLYQMFISDSVSSVIIKNRYYCYKEYCYEFDEYLNLKEKMYTCEVELPESDMDDSVVIRIQELLKEDFDIIAIDVTKDYRYKNSNLHKYF